MRSGDLFGTTAPRQPQQRRYRVRDRQEWQQLQQHADSAASFTAADGSVPRDGLLLDAAGDLIGTTQTGGANGDGVRVRAGRCPTPITTVDSTTTVINTDPPMCPDRDDHQCGRGEQRRTQTITGTVTSDAVGRRPDRDPDRQRHDAGHRDGAVQWQLRDERDVAEPGRQFDRRDRYRQLSASPAAVRRWSTRSTILHRR